MPKKKAMPAPASRTPTAQETALETQAILQLRSIGNGLGYQRLSARVVTAFRQYRYVVTNMQRRNRVYRALSGLLTYVGRFLQSFPWELPIFSNKFLIPLYSWGNSALFTKIVLDLF
ncbi:uncharacterized protein LOC144873661 [Branchiostoma floridae x Branchiostoma japonicum]